MLRMRIAFQHRLNPLHLYCRLVPVVGKYFAMALARRYEIFYRKVL